MSFQEVGTLDELDAEPLAVTLEDAGGEDVEVAIFKVGDEVFALVDECSHGHVRLSEGEIDEATCSVDCWLHGSRFDLRTGAAINLPATQPVTAYPVRIDAGLVLVDVDEPIQS